MDKYTKNQTTSPQALDFGKYKDVPINRISDYLYLRRALKWFKVPDTTRQAIASRIDSLEFLFK